MKATVVPYSSVVGQSITLQEKSGGPVIGQLGLFGFNKNRDEMQDIAREIATLINEGHAR